MLSAPDPRCSYTELGDTSACAAARRRRGASTGSRRRLAAGDRRIAQSAYLTPQSTALRYVGLLEKVGLIRRARDPYDGRCRYLELTEVGFSNVQAYLAEAK
jgi:hypothetical protein